MRSCPRVEPLERRRLLSSTFIPAPYHAAVVFDSQLNQLLITTGDGYLQRYDVASGQLLPAKIIRNSPGFADGFSDVSPDGAFLYVAETDYDMWPIRKVNLAAGTVSGISYPKDEEEQGAFDLATASDGRVLFTSRTFSMSMGAIRQMDPLTGAVTKRNDAPGVTPGTTGLAPDTLVARSADRSFLVFAEPGNASGPAFTYSADTDSFSPVKSMGFMHESGAPAVNRDGSLVAFYTGTGIAVFDRNIDFVHDIGPLLGGMAFDPTRDVMYAVDSTADQIVAIDTTDWSVLYSFPVGENVSNAAPLVNGLMVISGDGTRLFLTTPTGVRMYPLVSSPGSITAPLGVLPGIAAAITVTATAPSGVIDAAYVGTIHFTSTDPTAVLPEDYTFTAADAGSHTFPIALAGAGSQGVTVADVATHLSANQTIKMDAHVPTAALVTPPADISYPYSSPQSVTVRYTDDTAIASASIGAGDVVLLGPNGLSEPAMLVSTYLQPDGTPIGVTYAFQPPGGWWDPVDNGTYTVELNSNAVTDVVGNAVPGGDLGSFQVSMPGDAPDLTPTLLTPFPAQVLSGEKGTATLAVTNNGNLPISSSFNVELVLSTDPAFGGGDALIGGFSPKQLVRPQVINPRQTKTYRVSYGMPANLAEGTYYLLAVTDPFGFVRELDEGNNTAVAPMRVELRHASVDLKAEMAAAPQGLAGGRPGHFSMRVSNTGNVAARGPMFARLILSADQMVDAADPVLAFSSQKINIPAGASKLIMFKFKIPLGLAAGSYYFLANIGPDESIGDANSSDDAVVSQVLIQ